MTSLIQKSGFLKKRPKRIFSLEDKKRLYAEWQKSGLNKNQFCKKQDLVLSAFAKWCRQLSLNQAGPISEKNWVPVVSKDMIQDKSEKSMLIDIKFSNGMAFQTSLTFSKFTQLLKELCHADTIVR